MAAAPATGGRLFVLGLQEPWGIAAGETTPEGMTRTLVEHERGCRRAVGVLGMLVRGFVGWWVRRGVGSSGCRGGV